MIGIKKIMIFLQIYVSFAVEKYSYKFIVSRIDYLYAEKLLKRKFTETFFKANGSSIVPNIQRTIH
jgi:hypothetical protein